MGPPIPANPHTLSVLREVWSERRTGALVAGPLRAHVVRGDAASDEERRLLVEVVGAPGVRFEEGPVRISGPLAPVDALLLRAGRSVVDADSIRHRLDDALVRGPLWHRARDFEISDITRALIERDTSCQCLGEVLLATSLAPEEVADELAALIALGVVETTPLSSPMDLQTTSARLTRRPTARAPLTRVLLDIPGPDTAR